MQSKFVMAGDSRRAKLDAIQASRRAAYVDREQVLTAPLPADELRLALASSVKRAVDSGLPARADSMKFAGRRQEGRVEPSLAAGAPLTLSDLAWLFGVDEIVDKITSSMDANSLAGSVDSATRERQLAQLNERIRDLEIEEEREVIRLQDSGLLVMRRETADPEILLQVWLDGFAIPDEAPREIAPPFMSAADRQRAARVDFPALPAAAAAETGGAQK